MRQFAYFVLLCWMSVGVVDADEPAKVQQILKTHCHRCHGQDGVTEGGFNYVFDLDRLVKSGKVVPGKPEESPLLKKIVSNKMPPPGEEPRLDALELATLRAWIERGAASGSTASSRSLLGESDIYPIILADLEGMDRRARRFQRYFTLHPLWNAGLSEGELQTARNALAKLVNSLSWHPQITRPHPIDKQHVVLRIDLRDFLWDANLWNRILNFYPHGVLHDSATARAVHVASATRMPMVRADWFLATASRAPLYYDLLQMPASLSELERQLRVDAGSNIQQERVARAGFNGSGIAKNNRLLERHYSAHGAYWRSYVFEAVPQGLVGERLNLVPDRRNLFAYPLGPGVLENNFQHAGGEAIFNLPNGLQGYILVNQANLRVDKAPTAIVGDPKRPDKAVEAGVSCMGCHYSGILPKSDQIRDYVEKNPRSFSRTDAEVIKALYLPEKKMKALMEADAERFRHALEQTGNKVSAFEPILQMTLRYEADVDLGTLAGELGVSPETLANRIDQSALLARNYGPLKVAGGTVARQIVLQSFGDLVTEFRLGTLFQPLLNATTLPDNTGELDPLEVASGPANAVVFSADGRRLLFACADKSLVLFDVEAGRDQKRLIGHRASVWCVAFSPDGKLAASGGADNSVRLWEVEAGRERVRLEGHSALVSAVAFAPDGRRALSGGYDHILILWDTTTGQELRQYRGVGSYPNQILFVSDKQVLVAAEKAVRLLDLETAKILRTFQGHNASVVSLVKSADHKLFFTGSDDGVILQWRLDSDQPERKFSAGHAGAVRSLALTPKENWLVSGGGDSTVRVWSVAKGTELNRFTKHEESVLAVLFAEDGQQTITASRDRVVKYWTIPKK